MEYRRTQIRTWMSGGMLVFVLIASSIGSILIPEIAQGTEDNLLITGRLIDSKTGEPVVGGAVQIEGTTIGTLSDVDGYFVMKRVHAGEYTVIVKCVGYSEVRIEEVAVAENGKTPQLELSLQPETINTGIVVEVKAKALRNTEASLLKERELAPVISDAISSEAMSRSGSGDAAAALKKVPGATITDGKYVVIRGMQDRYVATNINGSRLPSPVVDKQVAPMDLFPSYLLDNIVVQKTFSPDKPGDFSGGSVNLSTRQLAGERLLKFSTSSGYNSLATFKSDFLTYRGGKTDWLGIDDGTRDMPDIVRDRNISIPNAIGKARRDSETAVYLDKIVRSFNGDMYPVEGYAPLNQKYSLSYGNTLPLFNLNMSVLASLTYSRSFKSYRDGVAARWSLDSETEMRPHQLLSDYRSTDEVLWGHMLNATLPVAPGHKFTLNYTLTRNAESQARYLEGPFEEAFTLPTDFQTRVLKYNERQIESLQLGGEHQFSSGRGIRTNWQVSFTSTSEDEPDFRTFSNNRRPITVNGEVVDTLFDIQSNQNPVPSRIYRALDESNREASVDLSIPFSSLLGQIDGSLGNGNIKIGTDLLTKKRNNSEREFEFNFGSIEPDIDRPEDFFAADNFGLLDSSGRFYEFGFWWDEEKGKPNQTYSGDQEVIATYSQFELPLTERFTVTAGARYEKTLMRMESQDTTGTIDTKDILPSVNAVFKLRDRMNLRLSYGKTLARPTFREFAKVSYYSYATGYIVNGNPQLTRSLIDNYDLRWEFFERPGELYAISFFYKKIRNPIELGKVSVNSQIKYTNVDLGIVKGAELEIRKSLDQANDLLRHIQIGGNLTIVESRVAIPADELATTRNTRPDARDHRPLEGQSPYALNLNLAYVNPERTASLSLSYNVFGKRLVEKGRRATPDAFEQPRHELDMTFSKGVYGGLNINGGITNLFNAKYRVVHEYKGVEYVRAEHDLGRTFSLGLSYEL